MTNEVRDDLDKLLDSLDPALYDKLLDEVKVYQSAVEREKAQVSFMEYVKMM